MPKKNLYPNSILLLVCFFGKLPWYFDYYIFSCSFNPTIDFLIFTNDITYKKALPKNVSIRYMDLDMFNKIASKKLGFSINVKNGYKLCDFKPTYGLLFNKILKGYDFWAYGDIDVIYGNIRNLITDDVLNKHEIISVRHDYLTGYFQIFKNNYKMINLFKKSKDFQKVLQSDNHYCFDETNFAFEAFSCELQYDKINTEVESMMHVVKKEEATNKLAAYFDFHVIEGIPGRLKWKNGNLLYKNKYEILLYHLIVFKKEEPVKLFKKIPSSFFISPTRIYHKTNLL